MTKLPPQPWIEEPHTQALLDALQTAGIAARFVGGVVRDALLGHPIADIDLATPAHPESVVAALEKAGIKVVPTGLAHGTVTAVVPPRHYEITTLRRDVETDGRRALVAFDADWGQDAARRDFTINAIYLDPDGTLHDPVGGLADLKAHRVRFVGDPATRIAEDVLRVLRYYRFWARFGSGPGNDGGDPAARDACRAAVPLLPKLSAERVARELMGLLGAQNPAPSVRFMAEDGVLGAILPEAVVAGAAGLDRLEKLIAMEASTGLPPPQAGEGWGGGSPDKLRRLAALAACDAEGAARLAERLRFSIAWRDRLVGLAPPWPLDPSSDERAQRHALYRLGAERYRDLLLLIAAAGLMDKARLGELSALTAGWSPPEFPLAGRDVTALGIMPGPRIGQLLGEVRAWWEAGDFAADRKDCLAHLKNIAAIHGDGPQS